MMAGASVLVSVFLDSAGGARRSSPAFARANPEGDGHPSKRARVGDYAMAPPRPGGDLVQGPFFEGAKMELYELIVHQLYNDGFADEAASLAAAVPLQWSPDFEGFRRHPSLLSLFTDRIYKQ